MPSSTISNKESQLIFSPDPASLERTIRKEARSLSIDNNTSVSLDSAQPPSTQTPAPSIDTLHQKLIDIPSLTSIDTEPRDMVAPLILVRENNGDLHDQEGHLRNEAAKHPHPPSPDNVRIDRHANNNVDRHSKANINQQPSPPIDRRAPITYRVHMPKIDVARLNALRPKPKSSEQPPEPVRTPSDDGDDPMEEDRVFTGRTLRRRKEKVAKHLKRGANEKEKENFQKRVLGFLYIIHSKKLITATDCGSCHCGAEYESDYSESIDTHPVTSIDTNHTKSTDADKEKSVDTYPDEWENEYYNPTIGAYTSQNMHTDEYDEDFEEE
ncbi:hypothetical protein F2Q69_00058793 [Brassica cretica]|uniref:Uncharacterized protein n=1 Tax=Brassica cretica TaxID=69181 RepID=A0A8S9RC55_BRACR|nr:hypothetical protein F2Q69_00058793 [Brassica cretica]